MVSASTDPSALDPHIRERRERVFIVLAGFFLGSLAMLNIIGITRFVHIGPLALAVGVLPYPLTFLCTDFISELYGRRRANFVVWVGLLLNVFVLFVMWLGHVLPGSDSEVAPPWQTLTFAEPVSLPGRAEPMVEGDLFEMIYLCTRGAVFASMVAYFAAQFCDVYLFHFWKRLTKGRHLWLRNNGSTLVSQLIDATAVIFITFWGAFRAGDRTLAEMLGLVLDNYGFKCCVALIDTVPFYIGVHYLSRYLRMNPMNKDGERQP